MDMRGLLTSLSYYFGILGKVLTVLSLLLLFGWFLSLILLEHPLPLTIEVTFLFIVILIWSQIYQRVSEVLTFYHSGEGQPANLYATLRNLLSVSFVLDLIVAVRFVVDPIQAGQPWAESMDMLLHMAFPGTMGVTTFILALVCNAASNHYRAQA